MARKRMIDPAIWESAYSKSWTTEDFLVMIAAISLADDSGRGKISEIRRNCEKMLTEKKLKKSLTALSDSLVPYSDGFYFLPKWLEYQTINRPRASKLPEPPGEIHGLISDDSVINHEHVTDDSRASESEVKVSEVKVNLNEINVSEVKGKALTNFDNFFTLFHLTFHEPPTTLEKNQISTILRDYDLPADEKYKILKTLCQEMQTGPPRIKTKAYFFGTFPLKMQDYFANKNIKEAQKLKKDMENVKIPIDY